MSVALCIIRINKYVEHCWVTVREWNRIEEDTNLGYRNDARHIVQILIRGLETAQVVVERKMRDIALERKGTPTFIMYLRGKIQINEHQCGEPGHGTCHVGLLWGVQWVYSDVRCMSRITTHAIKRRHREAFRNGGVGDVVVTFVYRNGVVSLYFFVFDDDNTWTRRVFKPTLNPNPHSKMAFIHAVGAIEGLPDLPDDDRIRASFHFRPARTVRTERNIPDFTQQRLHTQNRGNTYFDWALPVHIIVYRVAIEEMRHGVLRDEWLAQSEHFPPDVNFNNLDQFCREGPDAHQVGNVGGITPVQSAEQFNVGKSSAFVKALRKAKRAEVGLNHQEHADLLKLGLSYAMRHISRNYFDGSEDGNSPIGRKHNVRGMLQHLYSNFYKDPIDQEGVANLAAQLASIDSLLAQTVF